MDMWYSLLHTMEALLCKSDLLLPEACYSPVPKDIMERVLQLFQPSAYCSRFLGGGWWRRYHGGYLLLTPGNMLCWTCNLQIKNCLGCDSPWQPWLQWLLDGGSRSWKKASCRTWTSGKQIFFSSGIWWTGSHARLLWETPGEPVVLQELSPDSKRMVCFDWGK